MLGCLADINISNNSDADVAAAWDGDFGVGTTPASDATITAGDVDLIASTSTGAATLGVSPQKRVTNAVQAIIDNTAGDLELNLNILIDDANISGPATLLVNGFFYICYVVLGDD